MRDKSVDFIVERFERKGNRQVRIGKFYCVLNGRTYDTLGGLRNAIKPSMTVKSFYDTFYKTAVEGVCQGCGKGTSFKDLITGYKQFCNTGCAQRTEAHRKAVSERFIGNPAKKSEAVSKLRATLSNKPAEALESHKQKRQATIVSRYGEDYLANRTREQWKRYTEDQRRRIVEKQLTTKRKNGTMEFSWYSQCNKRILIDHKEFSCQGYEDQVIHFLVDYGFTVDDILTGKDVPRIRFDGNKSGWHRPDIFLPALNLIIEVKSDFTYAGTRKMFSTNHEKQKATLNAGFNHVIFAIRNKLTDNDKKEFRSFLDMTISSQSHDRCGQVQRLSVDTEYRPIAIGSGSARRPKG